MWCTSLSKPHTEVATDFSFSGNKASRTIITHLKKVDRVSKLAEENEDVHRPRGLRSLAMTNKIDTAGSTQHNRRLQCHHKIWLAWSDGIFSDHPCRPPFQHCPFHRVVPVFGQCRIWRFTHDFYLPINCLIICSGRAVSEPIISLILPYRPIETILTFSIGHFLYRKSSAFASIRNVSTA